MRGISTYDLTELLDVLLNSTSGVREGVLRDAFIRAVPARCKPSAEIELTHNNQKYTVRVADDYLAIGNDEQYVRMPCTPLVAEEVADFYGCILPTKEIVDAIWNQADIRLEPRPLSTKAAAETATYLQHDEMLRKDLAGRPGLVAGHKKDLIQPRKHDKVTIYGWHRLDGSVWQPVQGARHADWYVDYSHGARLVQRWAWDSSGSQIDLLDVLSLS